jgi:hypothetical protein
VRTLIICHRNARLDREGLTRWLGSFSTLAGVVVIDEPAERVRSRVRREFARVGPWRFVDVLAYRAYHAFAHRSTDREWERRELARLGSLYPHEPPAPAIAVTSPNSAAAEAFVRQAQPDLVLARCKTILKRSVFSIPRLGTYVMHPGICPEYRNAHGCFWALASDDAGNVGMTLLRIDDGVDTGPAYGYFRVNANPSRESHIVTQHRAVFEHLDPIRDALMAIEAGRAAPIETNGRRSQAWGQPWLSAYIKIRMRRKTADPRLTPTPGRA